MDADNRARCPDILTFGFLLFRPHSDKQKCETKNAGGSEHKAQMIFQSNELSKQLIVENCTERAVGRFKKASMNSIFLKYKKFLVPARRPSRPMLEDSYEYS